MPSLLDPNDELISPEERKAITQQNLFSTLLQSGLQLAAAGDNLYPWQRAQMLGQVAQTVGGMPGNQQQGLQNAAQQKLMAQKVAKEKRQEAADAELMKVGENPAFLETLKQMPADMQSIVPALFKSGRARDAVTLVDNWRTNQQREQAAQIAANKLPFGWERGADGGAVPTLGGPFDPDYIKRVNDAKGKEPIVREVNGQLYRVYPDRPAELIETNGGRPIDNSLRDDLNKSVTPMRGLMSLGRDFKDEYAGYKYGAVGNAVNLYGLNLAPEGTDAAKQAQWWQSYQEFANLKRNALFGSALTATEKSEFDKAMINPGMSPSQIRENLQKQQDIAKSAVSRLANSAKESGINPKALESLMGMSFDEVGSPMTKPAPAVQNNAQGVGNIPAAAINHLRQNPGLREAFDQKYGAGASARVLGQ